MSTVERAVDRVHSEVRDDLRRLFGKLEELNVSVAAHHALPSCPKPGLCLELDSQISDLYDRLSVLESVRNQQIGERAIIGATCTFIGGSLVWLMDWWFNHHGK